MSQCKPCASLKTQGTLISDFALPLTETLGHFLFWELCWGQMWFKGLQVIVSCSITTFLSFPCGLGSHFYYHKGPLPTILSKHFDPLHRWATKMPSCCEETWSRPRSDHVSPLVFYLPSFYSCLVHNLRNECLSCCEVLCFYMCQDLMNSSCVLVL